MHGCLPEASETITPLRKCLPQWHAPTQGRGFEEGIDDPIGSAVAIPGAVVRVLRESELRPSATPEITMIELRLATSEGSAIRDRGKVTFGMDNSPPVSVQDTRGIQGAAWYLGVTVIVLGLALTLCGVGSLVASWVAGGASQYYWAAFLGLPVIALGSALTESRKLVSYEQTDSGEMVPVTSVQSTITGAVVTCGRCQATNPSAAEFCNRCGTALETSNCLQCGAEAPPNARFCTQCGAAFKVNVCAACGSPMKGLPRYCNQCGRPVV